MIPVRNSDREARDLLMSAVRRLWFQVGNLPIMRLTKANKCMEKAKTSVRFGNRYKVSWQQVCLPHSFLVILNIFDISSLFSHLTKPRKSLSRVLRGQKNPDLDLEFATGIGKREVHRWVVREARIYTLSSIPCLIWWRCIFSFCRRARISFWILIHSSALHPFWFFSPKII